MEEHVEYYHTSDRARIKTAAAKLKYLKDENLNYPLDSNEESPMDVPNYTSIQPVIADNQLCFHRALALRSGLTGNI